MADAGVAHPVYCANQPKAPLILSKARNQMKLFLCDVGLLASMYSKNIQIKLLNRELDINYGGIFENAVAQELSRDHKKIYMPIYMTMFLENRKQESLIYSVNLTDLDKRLSKV